MEVAFEFSERMKDGDLRRVLIEGVVIKGHSDFSAIELAQMLFKMEMLFNGDTDGRALRLHVLASEDADVQEIPDATLSALRESERERYVVGKIRSLARAYGLPEAGIRKMLDEIRNDSGLVGLL